MLCARPVIVVAPVTAAVTEGPAPPMVIDVRLTASTRPEMATCNCPDPAAALAEKGEGAVGGVPLIRKSPTAPPAAAAAAATATATQAENPGTPPWPQRLPAGGPAADPGVNPAAVVAGHPYSGHPSRGHPSRGHPSRGHPSRGGPSCAHP